MPLVSELADLICKLGELVSKTREIVDAVNDGKKFLASRHPEAQQDFSDLLGQMQRTMEGLAKVTSVIRGFCFVTHGRTVRRSTAERELARFNDYVIGQQADIAELKNSIRDLKANCEKVRSLRDKLDARTETRSWGSLFGLLGTKTRQRSLELHSALSNFYADDKRMIEIILNTLELAESGINDVQSKLGPPGMHDPYNVPVAAETLRIYAALFDEPWKQLDGLADALGDARNALRL